MTANDLYAKVTHPFKVLFQREQTTLGRQRLTLLLFCYLPVFVLGILANFLGLTQPSATFFKYTHSVLLAAAIVFFWAYCKQKIDIGVCLAAFTLFGQGVVSVEMIYCVLRPTPYYIMLIMANVVLLTLNMMVSMAASMRVNTMILGFATLAIYVACAVIADDASMKSFIIIFIIAFCSASMVGVWISESISKIETENEKMKREETEVLHILRLKRNEVRVFITLASEKFSHDGTKVLLERLDAKSRNNILTNVEVYLKNKNTDLEIIRKVFPEFSQSEREICRLILQNKKQSDICTILKKSESNVNSQRANMRRKLGLKPTDNLQKVLEQRIDKAPKPLEA